MHSKSLVLCGAAIALMMATASASADTLKSDVAFNTGIGKETANQPADGVEVAYQITLEGGDLDGCTVDVVEQLRPREQGAWGLFDIAGTVTCNAGSIVDGSGSGRFENVSGRVAQLNGGGADAGDGTTNISYDLVFDTTAS